MDTGTTSTYHLTGVAGIGMSGLAQIALAAGHAVTGSDRDCDRGCAPDAAGKLQRAGVRMFPQDGSGIGPRTRAVVCSSAVEQDNPDVRAALALGKPVMRRAELLRDLAAGHTLVCIAGTSGKTTVTAMVGWLLDCLGRSPTVVNGGLMLNWVSDRDVGNVRLGNSGLWVIEVDESDRSLLVFTPDYAVITNISKDHFDEDAARALFAEFRALAKRAVVDGADLAAAALDAAPSPTADGTAFRFRGMGLELRMLGEHNVHNALQSLLLCERMGCEVRAMPEALRAFQGVHRRLEVVGRPRGITVIDDAAHNPAKIRAALAAARARFPRVHAAWRPHGFRPLAFMMPDLLSMLRESLRPGDRLHVLPVYYAGGTVERTVTSQAFVEALATAGVPAAHADGYDALSARLRETARPGDAVLLMGARDPELPRFALRCAAELA